MQNRPASCHGSHECQTRWLDSLVMTHETPVHIPRACRQGALAGRSGLSAYPVDPGEAQRSGNTVRPSQLFESPEAVLGEAKVCLRPRMCNAGKCRDCHIALCESGTRMCEGSGFGPERPRSA